MQSQFTRLLENAKKFSDLGIAIPALLYTSGFVVLGGYAEQNDLGLQIFPAIQFFSAGAGFLIILTAIILAVGLLRFLLNWCFNWLVSENKVSKLLQQKLQWLITASLLLFFVGILLRSSKVNDAAGCLLVLSMFISADKFFQKMARYYLYWVGFVAAVALLGIYAFVTYSKIPASFGGGKPRHAWVQMDTNAISAELSRQITLRDPATTGKMAVLDAEIYLITDSSIVMKVVRATPSNPNISQDDSRNSSIILQVRRSDVSAIFWDSRH